MSATLLQSKPTLARSYSLASTFAALVVLTAGEVGWGIYLHGESRALLWGGLIAFAVLKALCILLHFMHLRFERLIVWALLIPTPALGIALVAGILPDVAVHPWRDHPIGSALDRDGRVVDMLEHSRSVERRQVNR